MILTALVNTEILARQLADPDWVVFDCRHDLADPTRGRRDYSESHIPGARFLHLDEDLSAPKTGTNGRHPLPDPDALMGNKWTAEGRPQSAEVPRPQPARFAGKPGSGWVNAEYVRSRLDDAGMVLVDARAPDRFRGQNETLDPEGGRIPGARNRCYRDNLDANGCFKPASVLRQDFVDVLGDADPEHVVHYCGSGVSACHNLLAMETAGLRGARLYPGSWSEWCADPSRPVARGEP